jgi:hypothetical protein
MLQAHGTKYDLPHEPFVIFDLMRKHKRLPYYEFMSRVDGHFVTPRLIHLGSSINLEDIILMLEPSGHGAVDPVEGAVFRVERKGKVDFLAKYVRPDKVDGKYLDKEIWNKLRSEDQWIIG